MVQARELGLGLDIAKHSAQKAFQVDSALQVHSIALACDSSENASASDKYTTTEASAKETE
jgi:hypothetical protein